MHDHSAMSPAASRYIEDILRRVTAPAARMDSLRDDLEGHFREATEQGEPDREVIRRLGTPEEVAAAFMLGIDLRHAGFWERLVAFLGDAGLGLVAAIPLIVISAVLEPQSGLGPWGVAILVLLGLTAFGIAILYFPVLEHHFGKTYGKHLMGLRVIGEDGAPITLGAAFVRRLSLFFDLLWLDALFIPFTERKQRAFDIVAKTLVVHEPDREQRASGWWLCLLPWVLIAIVLVLVLMLRQGAGA